MSIGEKLLDFTLGGLYLFSNPFRICRRFFQKRGEENIHAYGETPLILWASLAELAVLRREDVFLDLGCGRGRLCLWSSLRIGCRTIGVDFVPTFIHRARICARLFRLPSRFICSRITEIPLEEATVVYLYTYHPDEERIDFGRLRSGARVITVSEPLQQGEFWVRAIYQAVFPWGATEVYINCRI